MVYSFPLIFVYRIRGSQLDTSGKTLLRHLQINMRTIGNTLFPFRKSSQLFFLILYYSLCKAKEEPAELETNV